MRRWRSSSIHRRFLVRQERAGALLGDQHLTDFELPIGADHGVGIDRQIDGQLANSWQLITRRAAVPAAMPPST